MGSILQWNCRGLMNNYPKLCLFSQQYNPVSMCLQETHIADISKVSFKGYTPYHRLDNSHDRASGGSSILIRNDVIHTPVNLNATLQAVAVQITLTFVFTFCSNIKRDFYLDVYTILNRIKLTIWTICAPWAPNPRQ